MKSPATETNTGGTTMATKFGATATGSRSWTTDHKGVKGASSASIRRLLAAAAHAGTYVTYDGTTEATAMAHDIVERAAELGETVTPAAAYDQAARLLGLRGSRSRVADRLVTRVTSRLDMGWPERVAGMHAHKAGLIDDAEWDAIRAMFTGTISKRANPNDEHAIDIVLTPKGREVMGIPPAKPGEVIGFTRGNRHGGGREIYA